MSFNVRFGDPLMYIKDILKCKYWNLLDCSYAEALI